VVGLRGPMGVWSKAAVLLCLALVAIVRPGSARGEEASRPSASRSRKPASAGSAVSGAQKTEREDRADPEGSSGGKDADEPLRRIAGNMHMEVLARDLRFTPSNAQRLKRIAARYFKATRARLVVTGGTRSPLRQAQLVYEKLKHGDDILALYENKGAATELRNAYREAVAKGWKRKATIRAIRALIDAQIARGVYISKHLRSGAVDVRSWNMEGAKEKALREAVKQEPGASLMDERNGPEPHFHLNLR
jgi:hypothetical protein